MNLSNFVKKVVILDDNFAIRQVLRLIVGRVLRELGVQPEIYSIDDGVEGVGYILVTNPDIVIIDNTLPQYSGREVVEYIQTNPKFHAPSKRVIALDTRTLSLGNGTITYLSKQSVDFPQQIALKLAAGLDRNEPILIKWGILDRIASYVVRLAIMS